MNWKSLAGARKLLELYHAKAPDHSWPPYQVVANSDGEMARLHIGAEPPDGWTIIGMNCAQTASLRRIGTWQGVVVSPDWAIHG
jgi:hypothetical protein